MPAATTYQTPTPPSSSTHHHSGVGLRRGAFGQMKGQWKRRSLGRCGHNVCDHNDTAGHKAPYIYIYTLYIYMIIIYMTPVSVCVRSAVLSRSVAFRARGRSASACPSSSLRSPVHGAGALLRVEERQHHNHQQDKPENVSFGPAPAWALCDPLCPSAGSGAWSLSWKPGVLSAPLCRNLHLVAATEPEAELCEVDLVVPIRVDGAHQRLSAPAKLLRRRACTTTVSQSERARARERERGREREGAREGGRERPAPPCSRPSIPAASAASIEPEPSAPAQSPSIDVLLSR